MIANGRLSSNAKVEACRHLLPSRLLSSLRATLVRSKHARYSSCERAAGAAISVALSLCIPVAACTLQSLTLQSSFCGCSEGHGAVQLDRIDILKVQSQVWLQQSG